MSQIRNSVIRAFARGGKEGQGKERERESLPIISFSISSCGKLIADIVFWPRRRASREKCKRMMSMMRDLFANSDIRFTQRVASPSAIALRHAFSQGRPLAGRRERNALTMRPPTRRRMSLSLLPAPRKIGRWTNGNDFLPRHLVPTGA